jgi:hypothetical protein
MRIIARKTIEMKMITVPYLNSINEVEESSLTGFLEENGGRGVIESVNWSLEFPYHPITMFYVARTDKSLFISFFVRGNALRAVHSDDQKPVHEDSCVEFFCQIPANDYYANFEFNCIGTCSASRRKSRKEDVQPFCPDEMLTIKRYPSIGRKVFNEMSGHFKWDLTVEIPFALMGIDAFNLPEKILANFYKCADATENPHFVSWNPIKTENPDFHRPEFFGELLF